MKDIDIQGDSNALLKRARNGVYLVDEQVSVADIPKYLSALLTYTPGQKEVLKQFNDRWENLLTQTLPVKDYNDYEFFAT